MKKRFILVMVMMLFGVAGVAQAGNCADGDSIADLAIATPELSTLVAAVVKADLVGVLDSNRELTVFAPTNDAFDAAAAALLGAGSTGTDLVDALDVQTLTSILLYHIAPGNRDSGVVLSQDRVRMLDKNFTFPSVQDGAPFINDAPIALPDVDACNGVVHVIGGVLLPPSA